MTFLTPLLAGVAAAIAVPSLIILYFLKLRRRDLEISTTLLWKKAVQDLQANAPFQRLRRNILLLLQLLVLGGLLFALAQPSIKAQSLSGQKHVILIDRSASMSANDETLASGKPGTRLDAAKEQALALVGSMSEASVLSTTASGDQAMIVAFDTVAEPVQPFTNNKALLRAAIERIRPTDKPTAVEEAMRVALAHLPKRTLIEDGRAQQIEGLTEGEPVTIHLYSDGRIPDAERAKTGVENAVEFHRVGKEDSSNLALTTLRAQRNFEDPSQLTIYASVENTDAQARSVDVEFLIDGTPAQIKNLSVPGASINQSVTSLAESRAAQQEKDAAQAVDARGGNEPGPKLARPGIAGVVFKLERADGMLGQLRLRSPVTGAEIEGDALATDNRAWIVVPPARQTSVALVGAGNLFIKSALEGLPLARLDAFSAEEFEKRWAQGKAGIYDVVVLNGVMPDLGVKYAPPPPAPGSSAPTPANTLPAGSFLCFNAIPPGFGIVDKGTTQGAAIIDSSRDHPVTRYTILDPLRIATFRRVFVEPGSPVRTLATADAGPAIVEITKDQIHAVVVPFDPMESNWPLDLSFVVFLASATNYLGQEVSGGIDARALSPGTELRDRLPGGVADVKVRTPEGEAQAIVPDADGGILYRIPPASGVYEVTWAGPAGAGDVKKSDGRSLRLFAANLLDSRESDVSSARVVSFANTDAQAKGEKGKADRNLWPYLILGALAIALLEWYIYNRKVHV